MVLSSLKVEILIPKFYNDGRKIEGRKHKETARELHRRFGGFTQDDSPLIGEWMDNQDGRKYKDKSFSFWVICEDDHDTITFFNEFRKKLEERYNQRKILIYSIKINLM